MPDSPLRAALLAALGRRPTLALRRALAAELRSLADEQERLIAAYTRQQARPAATRLTPRKTRAGPGRAPSIIRRTGALLACCPRHSRSLQLGDFARSLTP